MAAFDSIDIAQGDIDQTAWGIKLLLTSFTSMSMTVNACLIVCRIFTVFQELKSISDEKSLRVTGGTKLRSIIFGNGFVRYPIDSGLDHHSSADSDGCRVLCLSIHRGIHDQDGSLQIGHDDPTPTPNFAGDRRRDDEIGGGAD